MSSEGAVQASTMLATRILAPNPGPMTLEGTNSYVLRHPGRHGVVVVDPGPLAPLHLRELEAQGRVELILLTHGHLDHSESAPRLSARTGAPVRARDPAHCLGAAPLRDGEEIVAGGCRIRIVVAPGHSDDSACFELPDDRCAHRETAHGSMLTGDVILGRGSTVIAWPGGSVAAHLKTLARLRESTAAVVLPGHGPTGGDLARMSGEALHHREHRGRAVVAALEQVGRDPDPDDAELVSTVVSAVYPALKPALRRAAGMSVAAHLAHLRASCRNSPESGA